MKLHTLVGKELRQRPAALCGSVLTIVLGVAALVAIRHITEASENKVSQQMAALGANVLILPAGASVQDYYGADLHDKTLPEEEVARILLANLPGVEKLASKLCVPTELAGQRVTLTGLLPQSEFQASTAWKTISMFGRNKHEGCKKAHTANDETDASPLALAQRRTIANLGRDELLLGADVAERTGMQVGARTTLFGQRFTVVAVLPRGGTVDDSRAFAHLHTVQELAKTGEVVSAIEVLACCEDAAGELIPSLKELLPQAEVITISRLVQTQVDVNRLLSRVSWGVLAVLVLAGGLTIAGTISSNVRERRREIGTLMALGCGPRLVAGVFMLKALTVGATGGVVGAAAGLIIALWGGPLWTQLAVTPSPLLMVAAIFAASLLSLAAAGWPAYQATKLDPCTCFQEI